MAENALQGQVAVVTGSSQGIGRAVARHMAGLGAAVVLAARNEAGLRELAVEIERAGGRALVCPTNVRIADEVTRLAERATEAFGQVDIWVNNAGVARYGRPLHEMADADWAAIMETNLGSVYASIRAIAAHMMERQSGHIINIASLAAHNPFAGGAAYAASKAALHGLTVSVAEELRGYGVRVSLICPGSVDTHLSPGIAGSKDRARMLRPEDVAHAVEMLVTQSPQSFISEVLIRPTRKP